MASYFRLILLLIAVFVLITLPVLVPIAEAAWTPWSCQWAVLNYPVTGGYLNGRGCARWWDGAELQWLIWADTYVPTSATITTYVYGYDSCNGGASWTYRMSTWHIDYNAGYGTSGNPVQGSYANCAPGSNHKYRTDSGHFRQATSGSSSEGTWGMVIF